MVWSILGWTLLGLLALVVLVLVLPATLYVEYREGRLRVRLRVLVVWLRLYPFKERKAKKPRKKKPKKKKTGAEQPEEEKEPPPEKTLAEKLHFVGQVLDAVQGAGRFVLRHMRVRGVEFAAALDMGEASDTAIWYGRLQGVIGTVRAKLENTFDIKFKRLELVPDFGGLYHGAVIFACKISAAPVIMLAAGFIGLKAFLIARRAARAARGAQQNGTGKPGPGARGTAGQKAQGAAGQGQPDAAGQDADTTAAPGATSQKPHTGQAHARDLQGQQRPACTTGGTEIPQQTETPPAGGNAPNGGEQRSEPNGKQ